jgi:hypothetical protein
MKKNIILTAACVAMSMAVQAQSEHSSAANFLTPGQKADVLVPFSVDDEGQRFEPIWGMDLQWINEQNLRKGVRHMGLENIGLGRSGFRATQALENDSVLGNDQISYLRRRSDLFTKVVGETLPLVLTADQEPGAVSYFVNNKNCNVDHWAAMINSHVHWIEANTKHPIIGVSPFNEPDYWTVEEGATSVKQMQVAKLLKEKYPRMADKAIVGANTLNNDKAAAWYNAGRQYFDWGNTHQLAGSFDTFAAFFQQLKQEGKVGYADEMHNVGEAMIGLEYGMTVGIWWGFDSRARGEFCDISRHGKRLAYAEKRDKWTAASVYRHDDGRVKAFIGSSERQANTTSYQFLSRDRVVYYDTQGPTREFTMTIPGGTGYQTGQVNAERVIDICWGEDVPRKAIVEGKYRIVNKATGTMLAASGEAINMQKPSNAVTQQWIVKPSVASDKAIGDFSFYDIESVSKANLHINVRDFSTADGATLLAYSVNAVPTSNEQWYLQYAGNGYYYIRNRESSLLLTTASSYAVSGLKVTTNEMAKDPEVADRQMWRLLPVGTDYETEAPAQPSGLTATVLPASIRLDWEKNSEPDVEGYTVLRAEDGTEQWNTIARGIASNFFVDNTCIPAKSYVYKVKAMDKAENLSEASSTVVAAASAEQAMTARWTMDGTLLDATENQQDGAVYGSAYYTDGKQGGQSLTLNGSSYVQLPYGVASSPAMTVCMWVKRTGNSLWERLFDFGNGTDSYMFLTPAASDGKLRFAIKNGGDEQTVNTNYALPQGEWKHIAVTIGNGKAAVYVDGKEEASATGITISPSDILPSLNYLGRSQFTADPMFNGALDDVRVYNYALTGEQVKLAMDGTVEGIGSPSCDNGSPTSSKAEAYSLKGIKATSKHGIIIKEGKKLIHD